MHKPTLKTYILAILLVEAVGALSALLTRQATRIYDATVTQPPLSPPPVVFPIVWGVLFALMGWGLARVWSAHKDEKRRNALGLFAVQLAFNFCWSIIFFNFRAFGLAFFWLLALWVVIFAMIRAFLPLDKPAALAQIPYLVWVSFAAYLNLAVWLIN